MIQKWDSWPSRLGPPRGAPFLLPVHQHQVILQQRALGVGPHHTHQAAGVQLLILVEGMRQLVHSLMGGGEGRSGPRTSPSRLPVLPAWHGGLSLLATLLPLSFHFTHKKSRAGSCQEKQLFFTPLSASSSDTALKLAVLCSKSS